MTNLYQNPEISRTYTNKRKHTTDVVLSNIPKEQVDSHFKEFYKDIFIESSLIGEIVEMTVCENHNDHLNGNVYIKFKNEESARKARDIFSTRWYDSKPVYCELSPVTDFRESCCRQHDENSCGRGGMCNFMHVKRPDKDLLNELQLSQRKYYEGKKEESRNQEESKSS
ncbi:hypothetical protein WICMUC_003201 [Wickerhamomyces mucosus]|uniref:RRM domain-containing protein n=1 Tax=Wickerhamomyces mucosus TaxID=1378264 RepID=A0A9P8PND3_9ASCO|nr:hypothetical protein WICMUC_003201 [Wickerhamomyces mucosus]